MSFVSFLACRLCHFITLKETDSAIIRLAKETHSRLLRHSKEICAKDRSLRFLPLPLDNISQNKYSGMPPKF
jgi:hypothetical protein